MTEATFRTSLMQDIDSDGRTLFETLKVESTEAAMILYGRTAFGFDENGEISDKIHYNVIRDLCFDPEKPDVGEQLLRTALEEFGRGERVYAFFHYFGMSACARHGKLHESQKHIHDLLLKNGFTVEHENVYYSRQLTGEERSQIMLTWRERNPGNCCEFAALEGDKEIGWGQVHFLPQRDIAYLRWIYIDQAVQRQGYGKKVMASLFAQLYEMGIHRFDTDTALNNIAAQHYYETSGFTNEGITRSYFTT